jgi:hypothetical protein
VRGLELLDHDESGSGRPTATTFIRAMARIAVPGQLAAWASAASASILKIAAYAADLRPVLRLQGTARFLNVLPQGLQTHGRHPPKPMRAATSFAFINYCSPAASITAGKAFGIRSLLVEADREPTDGTRLSAGPSQGCAHCR